MYQQTNPLFLIIESPLHVGSGSDLGDIDLPIQRESHTGYPKVEASSLKGSLRSAFEANTNIGHPDFSKGFLDFNSPPMLLHRLFGYDDDPYSGQKKADDKPSEKELLLEAFEKSKDFAGAIGFSDARILLFPVKSLKGTYAWVTCPAVLKRFQREMKMFNVFKDTSYSFPSEIPEVASAVSKNNIKIAIKKTETNASIQLEDYIYNDIRLSEDVDKVALWIKDNILVKHIFSNKIMENLVVLPDDDFADFVKYSTEVVTRIKIDNETGTVKSGALFTEEYLPTETVLYSLIMFSNEFRKEGMQLKEVEQFFSKNMPSYFQLGGNATLGKGIISTQFISNTSNTNK